MAAPAAAGLSRQVGEAGGKSHPGWPVPAPSAACEAVAEGSARPREPWTRDWGQRRADGASAPRVVGAGLRCLDLDIRGHRAEEQPARV